MKSLERTLRTFELSFVCRMSHVESAPCKGFSTAHVYLRPSGRSVIIAEAVDDDNNDDKDDHSSNDNKKKCSGIVLES